MSAAPRTIVITVPAKSGLTFRKAPQLATVQQRIIRATPPTTISRVVPPIATTTTTAYMAAPLGKRAASDLENADPFVVIQPPRKRERLTHLTPEEKLNRRKLKNRVAAQTARDRKKVRTNNLEDSVEQLNSENQKLAAENARLLQRLNQLSAENARLRLAAERVELEEDVEVDEKPPKIDNMAGGRQSDALGSAASINAPQQRDQALRKSTHSLLTLLMAYLTSICKESSTTCSAEPNSSTLRALNLMRSIRAQKQQKRPLTQTQLETLMEVWKALRRKPARACA